MKVHLFGATSSPSCANFALLQCVEDNREYFDPVTCKAVENNCYVDDFLLSVPTVEEAILMVQHVTFLCNLGGFHLTKWVSNSRQLLENLQEHERAKSIQDLSFDKLPIERAL